MTLHELYNEADYYKNIIEKNQPYDEEQLTAIDDYFRIAFTYSSNSFEGNTLSITETKLLLEKGTTVEGKPIRDYYEAAGHAQAYNYMLSVARMEQLHITEEVIRRLHFLFYHKMKHEEAGQYRKNQVYISDTKYQPPKAEDVPHLMEHFISQMLYSKKFMHPIEFAAMSHKRLIDIHPFKDGNGQIARLFMNLLLVNAGYGITIIPLTLRKDYNHALKLSQNINDLNIDAFLKLIAECVIEAEKEYCRLLKLH